MIISPTLTFQVGDVSKVPIRINIDDNTLSVVDKIVNENISLSKLDWDAHETSWDFLENELIRLSVCQNTADTMADSCQADGSTLPSRWQNPANTLAEAMERYKEVWREQFLQLHANEEELNRQFIEIYGLQDELTSDVPLDEVTILQKGEIDIVDGEIVWNEGIIIKQLIETESSHG